MAVARDLMSPDPVIVGPDEAARNIALRLATDGIGAVVVCGADDEMAGVITDRDLVVEVLARDRDPDTTAAEIVHGREVVTIGADDSVSEAIETMQRHAVRRLPVIDGTRVVGMLSQADLARSADDDVVGRMVEIISSAPDNTAEG